MVKNDRQTYSKTICFYFTDDSMENFIKEVLAASNRGVSAAKNVSGEPNWSFGQSLFFACTVITTIGESSGAKAYVEVGPWPFF